MGKDTFLVMLPIGAGEQGDAFERVKQQLTRDHRLRDDSVLSPFPCNKPPRGPGPAAPPKAYKFPKFKVGTLDSLMEASDDLAKVDSNIEATLTKIIQVGDQLKAEIEGDERQPAGEHHKHEWALQVTPHHIVTEAERRQGGEHKDPVDKYLREWQWNETKFTGYDKVPMADVVKKVIEQVSARETEVRSRAASYGDAKQRLQAAEKRMHGSLLHRDISKYIDDWRVKMANRLGGDPEIAKLWERVVYNRGRCGARWDGSSLQATPGVGVIFVCINRNAEKDFLEHYDTWGVGDAGGGAAAFCAVPGSADPVTTHEDITLYGVLVLKQKQADFVSACRDRKLVVRTYDTDQEGFDQSGGERKKAPGEELADAKAKKTEAQKQLKNSIMLGFDEGYSAWVHIKAIRAYVEAILRYGLPSEFVGLLWTVTPRQEADMRAALQSLVASGSYAQRIVSHRGYDDADDQGALQEKYPYVSLRVPNLAEHH
eukprot:TRINITY_DN64991_c0_g1_i1.p1 TRINITY_DN64991_c0_g1~~TRINITY_DN64991_c0_g1_i1.p1  ORF type:complete len:521 (+),score=190.94 TRINITY_DN64991_c0_g1_i1:109-1563(+)